MQRNLWFLAAVLFLAGGCGDDKKNPAGSNNNPSGSSGNGVKPTLSNARENFDFDKFAIRRLTENPDIEGRDFDPVWSPDGSKIAFVRVVDPTFFSLNLFVMNADGTDLVNLTPDLIIARGPAWSPDGTRIAISSALSGEGHTDIYTIDTNGEKLTRLTTDPQNAGFPDYSPDGSQIVYETGSGGDGFDVYIMDADGSNPTQVSGGSVSNDRTPAWSPDGERFAYTSRSTNSRDNIIVRNVDLSPIDIDGFIDWNLTIDNFMTQDKTFPAWSPAGAYIAYIVGPNLFVTDGCEFINITEEITDLWVDSIDWSPDGTKLVFSGNDQIEGSQSIYILEFGASTPGE